MLVLHVALFGAMLVLHLALFGAMLVLHVALFGAMIVLHLALFGAASGGLLSHAAIVLFGAMRPSCSSGPCSCCTSRSSGPCGHRALRGRRVRILI